MRGTRSGGLQDRSGPPLVHRAPRVPAWPSRTDNPNELVRPGSLRFPVSADIAESAGPQVQRIPVQAGELRLETALQLLQRSGQAWPEGAKPGSPA